MIPQEVLVNAVMQMVTKALKENSKEELELIQTNITTIVRRFFHLFNEIFPPAPRQAEIISAYVTKTLDNRNNNLTEAQLQEIYLAFKCSVATQINLIFLHGLLYFETLLQMDPLPPAIQKNGVDLFFVAAILRAHKQQEDTPFNNASFASRLGIVTTILNAREIDLITLLYAATGLSESAATTEQMQLLKNRYFPLDFANVFSASNNIFADETLYQDWPKEKIQNEMTDAHNKYIFKIAIEQALMPYTSLDMFVDALSNSSVIQNIFKTCLFPRMIDHDIAVTMIFHELTGKWERLSIDRISNTHTPQELLYITETLNDVREGVRSSREKYLEFKTSVFGIKRSVFRMHNPFRKTHFSEFYKAAIAFSGTHLGWSIERDKSLYEQKTIFLNFLNLVYDKLDWVDIEKSTPQNMKHFARDFLFAQALLESVKKLKYFHEIIEFISNENVLFTIMTPLEASKFVKDYALHLQDFFNVLQKRGEKIASKSFYRQDFLDNILKFHQSVLDIQKLLGESKMQYSKSVNQTNEKEYFNNDTMIEHIQTMLHHVMSHSINAYLQQLPETEKSARCQEVLTRFRDTLPEMTIIACVAGVLNTSSSAQRLITPSLNLAISIPSSPTTPVSLQQSSVTDITTSTVTEQPVLPIEQPQPAQAESPKEQPMQVEYTFSLPNCCVM